MKKFKLNAFYKNHKDFAYKVIGIGKNYIILDTEDCGKVTAKINRTKETEVATLEHSTNFKLPATNEVTIETFEKDTIYISNCGHLFKAVACGNNYVALSDKYEDKFICEIKFNADTEYAELSDIERINAVDYYKP